MANDQRPNYELSNNMEKEAVIVAIEFGSSKVSGIAGKMKEGTMQIIAYAEDRTPDCVKRGVVYNIEKTTQSIRNVVGRLESTLKQKVSRVYVGLGGQSVQSVLSTIQSNMQTPTCITQSHIDSITEESHKVSREDYELIGYFPQEYVVDSNVAVDPVGIVGTNLEGRYLNIIANRKLRNNIDTCFDNTDITIAGYKVSAYELARNILTDTEKRSGCALIDLGAGTTTVVIFKNNIVRLLTTIPLGYNNIIHDLCSLQIEESEAVQLLMKYGNGTPGEEYLADTEEPEDYTTSDGRTIKIAEIQFIIEARLNEILSNVRTQISKSEFFTSLLGGVVITGGGSLIRNAERAVMLTVKVDKVRTARKVNDPIIKNSTLTNLDVAGCMTNTVISLLLSGTEDCVGEAVGDPDFFRSQQAAEEIGNRKAAAAVLQHSDDEAYATLETIKGKLREAIAQLQASRTAVLSEEGNKRLRDEASDLILECTSIIGTDYDQCTRQLIGKDKYKQTLREAEELIAKRDDEVKILEDTIRNAAKKNSLRNKFFNWVDDLLNEK